MSVCLHCGVDDCEALFHECLVRDFTDADYGIMHHLTVGAYMLQHNSYTDEMASTMAEFVLEHLDRPPGDTEKRRIRAWTDGAQRVTRRGAISPLAPPGGWPLTIADIDIGDAESYRATVRAWAEAVARTMANA
jgi:hypothetical protein